MYCGVGVNTKVLLSYDCYLFVCFLAHYTHLFKENLENLNALKEKYPLKDLDYLILSNGQSSTEFSSKGTQAKMSLHKMKMALKIHASLSICVKEPRNAPLSPS